MHEAQVSIVTVQSSPGDTARQTHSHLHLGDEDTSDGHGSAVFRDDLTAD